MNQKALTNTFVMNSNRKNPLVLMVYMKKSSALRVKLCFATAIPNLKCVKINLIFYLRKIAVASGHCPFHIVVIVSCYRDPQLTDLVQWILTEACFAVWTMFYD